MSGLTRRAPTLGGRLAWLTEDRRLLVASLLASLAASASMVAIPPLAARAIVEPGRQGVIGLLLVLACRAAFGTLGVYGVGLCAARAITRARDRLFARLVSAEIPFHDREWSADQVAVLTTDMAAIQQALGTVLPALAQQAPTAAAGALYLFVVDWRLASVLTVALLPVAVFAGLATRALRTLAREGQTRLARLSVIATDTLRQIGPVKALRAEAPLEARFAREGQSLLAIKRRRSLWQALIDGVVPVSIVLLTWLAFRVGQSRILVGFLDDSSALTFAGLLGVVAATGGRLVKSLAGLGKVSGAIHRIRELERRCDEAQHPGEAAPRSGTETPADAADRPARAATTGAGVELSGVSFRHEATGKGVAAIDLRIEPGEWLALEGPNGSGKSTLLFLLLGFYRPHQGTIRIDGRTFEETGVDHWRSRIAWVGREPAVFPATVLENLRLAAPGTSRAEVEEAASAAGIHDTIVALPRGYDSEVGEGGVALSTGLRHRLALARLLLEQPSLLLLDEADASLDAEARLALPETLRRWFADRTLVAVSHAPLSGWRFDRHVRLEHGRLVSSDPARVAVDG